MQSPDTSRTVDFMRSPKFLGTAAALIGGALAWQCNKEESPHTPTHKEVSAPAETVRTGITKIIPSVQAATADEADDTDTGGPAAISEIPEINFTDGRCHLKENGADVLLAQMREVNRDAWQQIFSAQEAVCDREKEVEAIKITSALLREKLEGAGYTIISNKETFTSITFLRPEQDREEFGDAESNALADKFGLTEERVSIYRPTTDARGLTVYKGKYGGVEYTDKDPEGLAEMIFGAIGRAD